jgi:2'-5' RNA ligase
VARLFVAVWPPEDLLDLVADLPRPDATGLRWTSRDQWHVTLRFLGPVDDVEGAVRALDVVGAAPAPTATLGPAVGRFGQRVLHVPVTGLDEVAAAVASATAEIGRLLEARPFAGHLTLARAKRGVAVDLRRLVAAPVSGRWPVNEVCLMESHLSPRGARYEVVARVPLARGAVAAPDRPGA